MEVMPHGALGRWSSARGSLPPQPGPRGWQWRPPHSSPMKPLDGSFPDLVVWAFVPAPLALSLLRVGAGDPAGAEKGQGLPPAEERKGKTTPLRPLDTGLGPAGLQGPRSPLGLCLQHPPGPAQPGLWEAPGLGPPPWSACATGHGTGRVGGGLGGVGRPRAASHAHGLSHPHSASPRQHL